MNIDTLLDIISKFVWVLFLIFGIVTFIRHFRNRGLSYAFLKLMSLRLLFFFLIAITFSFLSASLVFIEPQKIGVVVSILSPKGYRDQPLRSGLRFIVPLAEKVVIYPIFWQSYTMSGKPTEGEVRGNDSIVARTKDGQEVLLDCSVIFRIDPDQVVRVHINWQDRYLQELVRPRVRGLVRSLVSKYTVNEVNSIQRQNLEIELDTQLRLIMQDEGFFLNTFILRNIAFSPEYASSVEQKQVAEQGRERRMHEADQIRELAEGHADRVRIMAEATATAIIINAQADADARVLRAEAELQALEMINQAISQNPNLLTYQYIERLSPAIRVMLVPNNAPIVLPVPGEALYGGDGDTAPQPWGTAAPLPMPTESVTDTLNPFDVQLATP
jgi:regulator of protease activity HflC (stomatin/prohibitin superfamily)